MALEVLINRLVPRAPVHAQTLAIPPLVVKRAVRKPRHLSQRVQETLEQRKEPRQPDDQGNGRQLQQALDNARNIERGDLVQRVTQHGRRVLRRREPDEHAETDYLSTPLGHERPPDFRSARVHGLVDQRGSPPEVAEVAHGDVLRIGTLRVQFRQGVELSASRVQVRVPQVAVGEGVRGRLEPDHDGVHLR